ncbi:MAG: hypothetical protein ACOCV1_07995 [Bacillota bacterium]
MNKLYLYLFDLLKNRKTLYYYNEFSGSVFMDPEDIKKKQIEKIRKLLIHAGRNSPFYHQLFNKYDFRPDQFRDFSQLKQIPYLTRSDLQNDWRNIVATNYNLRKLSKGSSSGSTGSPVFYYKDNIANSAGQAAGYTGWLLGGWKMSHKGLHIWGNPSTVNNEWKRNSSKLKAKLFRHHKFPAYKLSDGKQFYKLFNMIIKEKYDFIDGYTNAIYLFAEYLKNNNLSIGSSIKYVFTTAENLLDYQRRTIKENIAPVYDSYGCSEINGIAYECNKCNSYHIIDPHVYVEYGDMMDEYGSKELIITDLDNYAFPFIRYKLGDLAIPLDDDNQCEVSFSSFKSVSGRQSDILRFSDGGTLSVPSFFGSMLLKQIKGIRQYQIVRKDKNNIVIKIVSTNDFDELDKKKLIEGLDEYLKNRINYKIEFVNKIEVSRSGKFKLLIDQTVTQ